MQPSGCCVGGLRELLECKSRPVLLCRCVGEKEQLYNKNVKGCCLVVLVWSDLLCALALNSNFKLAVTGPAAIKHKSIFPTHNLPSNTQPCKTLHKQCTSCVLSVPVCHCLCGGGFNGNYKTAVAHIMCCWVTMRCWRSAYMHAPPSCAITTTCAGVGVQDSTASDQG